MGSHQRKDIRSGVVQVEKNIAGVAILGVGEKINVKSLKIACAQKAQHRSPRQLTHIPHSFTWARLSCGAMDQTNEIEIIRHGRQLATDCVRGEDESVIDHMLSQNVSYNDLGDLYLDKLNKNHLTRNLVHRLERLGYSVTLAPQQRAA
jgi:hypothetical protein